MRINQLLENKGVTLSLELFPPKKDQAFPEAQRVVESCCSLSPDFISVTFGANGGAYQKTLPLAGHIERCGGTALAHLTCYASTTEEVARFVEAMKAEGIQNVLALRGDIPSGNPPAEPGHFLYAADLVAALKEDGHFCVGAACYPEGHLECSSQEADLIYLKRKVDRGCDFLITQMFFDNEVLYKFLYRAGKKGIHLPVIAGIMPVINKAQIQRILQISGSSLPPRFANIVDRFGHDPAAMKQAGIAYATEQIIDLVANGVRGIHLYTMNKPDVAAQILGNVRQVVRVAS